MNEHLLCFSSISCFIVNNELFTENFEFASLVSEGKFETIFKVLRDEKFRELEDRFDLNA